MIKIDRVILSLTSSAIVRFFAFLGSMFGAMLLSSFLAVTIFDLLFLLVMLPFPFTLTIPLANFSISFSLLLGVRNRGVVLLPFSGVQELAKLLSELRILSRLTIGQREI